MMNLSHISKNKINFQDTLTFIPEQDKQKTILSVFHSPLQKKISPHQSITKTGKMMSPNRQLYQKLRILTLQQLLSCRSYEMNFKCVKQKVNKSPLREPKARSMASTSVNETSKEQLGNQRNNFWKEKEIKLKTLYLAPRYIQPRKKKQINNLQPLKQQTNEDNYNLYGLEKPNTEENSYDYFFSKYMTTSSSLSSREHSRKLHIFDINFSSRVVKLQI